MRPLVGARGRREISSKGRERVDGGNLKFMFPSGRPVALWRRACERREAPAARRTGAARSRKRLPLIPRPFLSSVSRVDTRLEGPLARGAKGRQGQERGAGRGAGMLARFIVAGREKGGWDTGDSLCRTASRRREKVHNVCKRQRGLNRRLFAR